MVKKKRRARQRTRTVALPEFNQALGEFLALPPHLEQKYSDVVTQIFPLKASMNRLQEFCDNYLNLGEDLPLYYRPAVPWVLMQVVDYGQMATTSKNLGWFSQHELAFGVPLRCYKKEKNEWVFVDWAMVFPFIFVDNPLSLSGGRKIYGWSKSAVKIDVSPSIFEPGHARRIASISLVTSGTNYGEPSGTEEFLQIYQRRPFVSASSTVTDLLNVIPQALASSMKAAYSIFETTGLFPAAYSDRDLKSLQEMLAQFYGLVKASAPGSFRAPPDSASSQQTPNGNSGVTSFNIITMKQIRDVHSSSAACFQAIVGSTMQIERTLDGGYLFDPLSGDTSGGIYINLLNAPVQPIAQTLGLETSEHASVGSNPASTLRPMMPFWLKMDLSYGLASSQCWRTNTSKWTTGNTLSHLARREITYLEVGSGASEEVNGPYLYPQIALRVMPLKAEKSKLQDLLDRYLENDFFKFEAVGRIKDESGAHAVVCLIGTNFERMTTADDPGIMYSDCEVAFVVPVSWSEKRNPRIKHPALIPLYNFVGTDWNAVTSSEMYGQLSLKSTLINPDSSWLIDPTAPREPEPLLTIETEVFPEVGESQEARNLPLLEILSAPGTVARGSIATYLKELGLSHFLTGNEFHSISLKQVMDAKDCTLANYQSLVSLRRRFTGINDNEDDPATAALPPLSVRVFDYPTFPIVGTLGLISESCDNTGPNPIFTLKPIDPFWVSGKMVCDAGIEMCSRAGTDWHRNQTFDAAIVKANSPKK